MRFHLVRAGVFKDSPRREGDGRPRSKPWAFALWALFGTRLLAADVDISKLPSPASHPVDFTTEIKPIFEASCFRCHGTERPKSRFSLASREAALKGGEEGIDIIVGDSARSPLIHYVAGLVPDMQMPPEGKGEPLTREQIALLRAWIEQGAPWEKLDTAAQYAAQFSFTPALQWVTTSGNTRKFQEHQWVRRGSTEGVSAFRIAQKTTNGVAVTAEGHALTEDYKISLDVRKDDLGFVRFGVEQFCHYYDDHGAYYPFRPRGFSTQVQNIYELDRDLHLDVGKAFAEVGLNRPGWPQVTVGYEYQFKTGDQSTEEWGPVSQQNVSSGAAQDSVTKHIYPASKEIDENVHVLRLDVTHDIAGTHLEDNLRAEFADLKTSRTADRVFPAGQVAPSVFVNTRESQDELVLANALHGERSINDWLFLSAGYLYSHFDADAAVRLDNTTGAGSLASGPYWMVNNVTLSEQDHVFNLNALGGPWDGLTAALGVQNEWSEKQGFGLPDYRDGAPTNLVSKPGWIGNTADQLLFEENAVFRYTKIPATALFAEARLTQDRRGVSEGQIGEHDFLRDTEVQADRYEVRTGFELSPISWASFNASYRHRVSESEYHDNIDADAARPNGPGAADYFEFIDSGDGYPGFIGSRQTTSDIFETRLVLRPISWLRATFSYQLRLTDFDTFTDEVFTNVTEIVNGAPVTRSVFYAPRGHTFAGEQDSATYSANITLTPWRRWFFSGTLSYEESRTWTADQLGAAVVPYRGDTLSALAGTTYVVSENTDLFANYVFSRSRFGQRNSAMGLPLGIDYDSHGIQAGISHRLNANITASLRYGFFDYSEPTSGGVNDYTAHMIFATLAIRLP